MMCFYNAEILTLSGKVMKLECSNDYFITAINSIKVLFLHDSIRLLHFQTNFIHLEIRKI